MLIPINSSVLVELTGELQYVEMPDKQYSTNTNGIVRAVDEAQMPDLHYLLGKQVFFEGFKDVEVPSEDTKYAFVKIEDIRGYLEIE